MNYRLKISLIAVIMTVILTTALYFNLNIGQEDEELKVLASYSIIYDLVDNIGGDKIELESIVPLGAIPEEFELLPENLAALEQADIIFANGFGIETWLDNVLDNINVRDKYVALTNGVKPIYLSESSRQKSPDPHAWLDPKLVKEYYIPNIFAKLVGADPENKEYYYQNKKDYQKKLEQLDQKLKQQAAKLEPKQRVLITSEGAYAYFAQKYDFETAYIWEINSHQEGTPEQITDLIDLIKQEEITTVFVESSVDPRPMKRVISETDAKIKGVLYSDSLGESGDLGADYLGMMEHNMKTVVEAITGEQDE